MMNDAIAKRLDQILNGPRRPSYVGRINITDISLGDNFPTFRNCRITSNPGDNSRLKAEMDVELHDQIALGVETKVILNYPRKQFAILPLSLNVSIVHFSATVSTNI